MMVKALAQTVWVKTSVWVIVTGSQVEVAVAVPVLDGFVLAEHEMVMFGGHVMVGGGKRFLTSSIFNGQPESISVDVQVTCRWRLPGIP
jgi:hypothetical protein